MKVYPRILQNNFDYSSSHSLQFRQTNPSKLSKFGKILEAFCKIQDQKAQIEVFSGHLLDTSYKPSFVF